MEQLSPETVAYVSAVVLGAQVIGRAIPDTATGIFGFIRKLAKVIGLYSHGR